MNPDPKEQELLFDIRRTIILGSYISHWGMPESRVVSRRGNDKIEVYSFPPVDDKGFYRFATVGLSAVVRQDSVLSPYELCMVLPSHLGGAAEGNITSFLLDVAAYSERSDVNFKVGGTIPETSLMPAPWEPKAILLDEPRGEPEDLASLHVGPQHVDLIWLVPIYKSEYQLIKAEGLAAFDLLDSQSEFSVVDPTRPPFLNVKACP